MARPSPCCLEYSTQVVFERDKLIAELTEERRMRTILQAKLSMAQSTAEELNAELFCLKSVLQPDGVKRRNKTDQMSETSNGQEILGAEEEPGTSVGAEEERVKAGPGRPKKKRVNPSQQLQVSYYLDAVSIAHNSKAWFCS